MTIPSVGISLGADELMQKQRLMPLPERSFHGNLLLATSWSLGMPATAVVKSVGDDDKTSKRIKKSDERDEINIYIRLDV